MIRVVDDVAARWPDSRAAAAFGVQTYVSVPVLRGDGSLVGSLCAVSNERRHVPDDVMALLELFARIIAAQVEQVGVA